MPRAAKPQKADGCVVMDLSAIGIPAKENSRLIEWNGRDVIDEGVAGGDFLIVEEGSFRDGNLVVAVVDQEMAVGRCFADGELHVLRRGGVQPELHVTTDQIVGSVVGMIRPF